MNNKNEPPTYKAMAKRFFKVAMKNLGLSIINWLFHVNEWVEKNPSKLRTFVAVLLCVLLLGVLGVQS